MRIITPTVQKEQGKNEVQTVLILYHLPIVPLQMSIESTSTVEQSLPPLQRGKAA